MVGLSNFILSINYFTKTFTVVQEFMINKWLKLNNPLFSNLPVDPYNYDDVIPVIENNRDAQLNNNENDIIIILIVI